MYTVFTGDFKISPEKVQTQIIFTQRSNQQINCENRASQTVFIQVVEFHKALSLVLSLLFRFESYSSLSPFPQTRILKFPTLQEKFTCLLLVTKIVQKLVSNDYNNITGVNFIHL